MHGDKCPQPSLPEASQEAQKSLGIKGTDQGAWSPTSAPEETSKGKKDPRHTSP